MLPSLHMRGPSHTKDHQFGIEAIPLEENMTFIHLRYSFGYSALGYFLMEIFGGGKVGFSEIGTDSEGNPVYVGGLRGAVERDIACYYLEFWRAWTLLRCLPSNDLKNGLASGMIWPLFTKNNC